MPGFVLTLTLGMQCPHGPGAVCATEPVQARVLVNKVPVATVANVIKVVPGCPFQIPTPVGPKPQPCATVQWGNISTRVMVQGLPVLLQAAPGAGAGICLSAEQIPAGPPKVSILQKQVIAT